MEIAEKIQQVRKSGLTFAPEAGTQRLRDVINKGVSEDDLANATRKAFEMGWDSVKLYFMIGLPTERYDDLDGISNLAYDVIDTYRDVNGGKLRRSFSVTVSTSTFVPKPFTPFQWHGQDLTEEVIEKQRYLVKKLKNRDIKYNYHDSKTSLMEAVVARGDRRIGKVILDAFKAGAKFDGWSEYFNLDIWLEAMEKNGLDIAFYANRERNYEEVFPWDHIDVGVTKKFLIRENEKAREDKVSPDCRHQCNGCGINANDIRKGALLIMSKIIRAKFKKEGDMIYISHLDLQKLLQRAFRRADVELSYSQGYNPHPKMSYGNALALGTESYGEYVDIEIEEDISVEEFLIRINKELPEGVEFIKAEEIEPRTPSLASTIEYGEYLFNIELENHLSKEFVKSRIADFMNKKK